MDRSIPLLQLQQALYHAMGLYHDAVGMHWRGVGSGQKPAELQVTAQAVRAAAADVASVLSTILDELGRMPPTSEVAEEIEHMRLFQELLQRELALLSTTEEANQ